MSTERQRQPKDAPDETAQMLASLRVLLDNGHPLAEAVRLTNEHFRGLERERRDAELKPGGLAGVVAAINDSFREGGSA